MGRVRGSRTLSQLGTWGTRRPSTLRSRPRPRLLRCRWRLILITDCRTVWVMARASAEVTAVTTGPFRISSHPILTRRRSVYPKPSSSDRRTQRHRSMGRMDSRIFPWGRSSPPLCRPIQPANSSNISSNNTSIKLLINFSSSSNSAWDAPYRLR